MKAKRGALTSLSEGEAEDKFELLSFTFYTGKKWDLASFHSNLYGSLEDYMGK